MVGLIFSRLQQSDNIGYIVPDEEIELFLKDIEDGRYDGKPTTYDIIQLTQNEALRARLKLPKDVAGMLIWRPDRDEPSYPLKRWDVITSVAGLPIDVAGRVAVDGDLRLDYRYPIQKAAHDGKVKFGVYREGKAITVDAPVPSRTARPLLMPYLMDEYPSYVVWGPLVFSAATEDFIHSFDQKEIRRALVSVPHVAEESPAEPPLRPAGLRGGAARHPDGDAAAQARPRLQRPDVGSRGRGRRREGEEPPPPGRAAPRRQGRPGRRQLLRPRRRRPRPRPQGRARRPRSRSSPRTPSASPTPTTSSRSSRRSERPYGSKAKTRFQSSFMPMTDQPRDFASAIRSAEKVPTGEPSP